MLTCAIIDDDEINRLVLERYVELTPNLQVVTSLADGLAGLQFFRAGNQVDVLFLDVDMPQLSGLELLRLLPDAPQVVITTDRQDLGVEAFELRVTDYLVKPVDFARFTQAMQRVQARGPAPAAPVAPATAVRPANASLFMKVDSRVVRLNFDDVLYVEALADYVNIVTVQKRYVVHTTLKALENRLAVFPNFWRVHRRYLLNTQHMVSIEGNCINLTAGYFVPIGKLYQENFFKSLQRM